MMNDGCRFCFNKEKLSLFRETYKKGMIVELLTDIGDKYSPVPSGTRGLVRFVDDACNIHVNWENGSSLSIIPGIDHWCLIEGDWK